MVVEIYSRICGLRPRNADRYVILQYTSYRQLSYISGFGAFSTVYSAVFRPPALDDRDDHIVRPETRECAIKVSSSHPDIDQLFKEAKMLGLSRHPNILR